MIDADGFPKIKIIFDDSSEKPSHFLYRQSILVCLRELLPDFFSDPKERSIETMRKKFFQLLPLVKTSDVPSTLPGTMSFFCLHRYRINSFKFFFDLISQWLIPGKLLNVNLIHAMDFKIPAFGEDALTLCEVMLTVENQNDLELIQRNFPLIETEARMGIDSEYYARKILEIKGVSSDEKTTMIQQHVATLIKRMPEAFSRDVFAEMQHILVLCHDDFKNQRTISHLSRLIGSHYLFRKELLKQVKEAPNKRHVFIKLFKTFVNYPQGKKQVLALTIGLNFLRDKEVIEQRHILKAIKHYVPNAEIIDQTFLSNRKGSESVTTISIEVEKSDGKPFSSQEVATLKSHLPKDLQNHVGRLMLPVFMPRNEEEILRNMLALSDQLKYLRDIPQVFISFDEQTDRNLFFTVIFVRIIKEEGKTIKEKIRSADSFLRYIHDRTRIVGNLRKKYPKEATVFRLKFLKDNFIRGDHSIDLYQARQAVVTELSRILGEFRDFNGGMISKQNELLKEVRLQLEKEGIKYNGIVLENFFYSLAPVIMRTVLEPQALKSLFKMVNEENEKLVSKEEKCSVKMRYEADFSYVSLTAPHRSTIDEMTRMLHKSYPTSAELVQGYVKTPNNVSIGYIFRSLDANKQDQFRKTVEGLAGQHLPA